MSYVLFGKIELNIEDDNKSLLETFAWKISKSAMENQLYVIFSPLIPQKIVRDMIAEQCDSRYRALDFLITSSPIANTSDAFFSSEVDINNGVQRIDENLQLINKWITTFMPSDEVNSVQLPITEGYDCNFQRVTTNMQEMLEVFKKQIFGEHIYSGFIPSLCFRITN